MIAAFVDTLDSLLFHSSLARDVLEAVARASLALIAAVLLAGMLRRHSAAVRHFVLSMGVVAAVVTPIVASLVPRWTVPVLPARAADAARARPVRVTIATTAVPATSAAVAIAATAPTPAAVPTPAEVAIVVEPSIAMEPVIVVESPDAGRAVMAAASNSWDFDWAAWLPSLPSISFELAFLLMGWLFGAIVSFAPYAASRASMARLRRAAHPVIDGPWHDATRRAFASATLDREIEVLESDDVSMPMTWGIVQPVVLLPSEGRAWSAERRLRAVRHELAHIERRDCLTLLVARIVCAFYWFNPLAWYAAARLRAESEHACDDIVLRHGATPSDYAQQLVDVVRGLRAASAGPRHALPMARRSQVGDRVRAILDTSRSRSRVTPIFACVAAAIGISVVATLAAITPVAAQVVPVRGPAPAVVATSAAPVVVATSVASEPTEPTNFSLAEDAPARVDVGGGSRTVEGVVIELPRIRPTYAIASTSPNDNAVVMVPLPPIRSAQQSICEPTPGQKGSTSINHSTGRRNGNEVLEVKWSYGDCRMTLRIYGEYRLSEDATDLSSLERDGTFELEVRDGGQSRRVRIEERDGRLERDYWVNGRSATYDAAAAQWLAGAIIAVDRRTAFAVDARLPRLLSSGGVEAVLAEVGRMCCDYAKRVYLAKLTERQSLTTGQVRQILQQLASTFSSDYERAELLITLSKQSAFTEATHVDFIAAARDIKSDYEMRRVMGVMLSRDNLAPVVVRALLDATQNIESDYEQAELLIAVSKRYAMTSETRPYYVRALSSLQSDYEHRRVLDAIVRGGALDAATTRAVLEDAARIASDYELAEFLIRIGNEGFLEDSDAAFFAAVSSLESDYEHGRVLKTVIGKRKGDLGFAEQVLQSSRGIASDYEAATLLLRVAELVPIEGRVREAYEQAAESIGSDYEYGRVMKALRARAPAPR
jgi:beta-lactamase regulating signal transducer with metallopeptidase domain